MCHNPDAKDILKSYHWNLMLSGHTHGGQFIVPFTKFAPFAPVADKSMIDGLHEWEDSRYIQISKGLETFMGFDLIAARRSICSDWYPSSKNDI